MNDSLLEDLFTAYFDARRNKRNTINALAFELHFESNLFALCEEIVDRRYQVSQSVCFVTSTPVQREIFAADFRDRVVHHLVFNYVSPLFEKRFIVDNYSCRVNKGTSFGISRIRRFMSQCSANYTRDAYVMKLDIEGYFMQMDRCILYDKVIEVCRGNERSLKCDADLLEYLLRNIIFNDPTSGCRIQGRRSDWNGLPSSKSLFAAPAGKGLPIGNLTSQLFGNVYLHDLDQFIKKELGIRHYGRYVDDLVLIHTDRSHLLECRGRIASFLRDKCGLRLHPRKFYLQHYIKGVPFLGVFIKPHRVYIGRRGKSNFYRLAKQWNSIQQAGDRVSREEVLAFRSRMNSYLGLLSHYNTYNLREKVMHRTLDKSFRQHYVVPVSLQKIMLRQPVRSTRRMRVDVYRNRKSGFQRKLHGSGMCSCRPR